MYRRALAVTEASYGPDHPEVANRLNNLAQLLRATDRRYEAEPMYRAALRILLRSLGPEHPWTRTAQGNLAAVLIEMSSSEAEAQAAVETLIRADGLTQP